HVQSLIFGGPQEEGRRAGTENVAGALSFVAALEAREDAMDSGQTKPRVGWREDFENRLLEAAPGTIIVGKAKKLLWNTVAALMPDVAAQARWVVKLDK